MTMTVRKLLAAVLAGALWQLTLPAAAVDGIAVEAGNGDSTDMGRLALQWDWNKRWFEGGDWHLGGYWDLGLGYWHRDALPGQNDSITEIGFTPVFRLQRNDRTGPYAEAAIGFHLLSKTTIGDKRLSTAFQFGDHLGVGYRFGVKGAFDLGYRYQHLSNGGIKEPNNGINFNQVRLQYHF
jgi:opacity protein-like surface antigen